MAGWPFGCPKGSRAAAAATAAGRGSGEGEEGAGKGADDGHGAPCAVAGAAREEWGDEGRQSDYCYYYYYYVCHALCGARVCCVTISGHFARIFIVGGGGGVFIVIIVAIAL